MSSAEEKADKAKARAAKYMNSLEKLSYLNDLIATLNAPDEWQDWERELWTSAKNAVEIELKDHMKSNSQTRQKLQSVDENIWKDPVSGTVRLNETPRPVLGYLPQPTLNKLDTIIKGLYSAHVMGLRKNVGAHQAKMRVSAKDKAEVSELMQGEHFHLAEINKEHAIVAEWEKLAALKEPIVADLKAREEFLQEVTDFEKMASGNADRYKQSSMKIEDENKFRSFAGKKLKMLDSDAVAACRSYKDQTGRIFEIDGLNYLEIIKEQKFGHSSGSQSLAKLPLEKITEADKQKFAGLKVNNLVKHSPRPGDKELRKSLYEQGIETDNVITSGKHDEIVEAFKKLELFEMSVKPAEE